MSLRFINIVTNLSAETVQHVYGRFVCIICLLVLLHCWLDIGKTICPVENYAVASLQRFLGCLCRPSANHQDK